LRTMAGLPVSYVSITLETEYLLHPLDAARWSMNQVNVKPTHWLASATPCERNTVGKAKSKGRVPIMSRRYPCSPPNPTNSIPQCKAPRKERMTAPYVI
jgi:hypothetical protein